MRLIIAITSRQTCSYLWRSIRILKHRVNPAASKQQPHSPAGRLTSKVSVNLLNGLLPSALAKAVTGTVKATA